MPPAPAPFVQNALCIYLLVLLASLGSSLLIALLRAPELQPWRTRSLAFSGALLASVLAGAALIFYDGGYSALPAEGRSLLEDHVTMQAFLAAGCSLLASVGCLFWQAEGRPPFPVASAWDSGRSVRSAMRAVPWLWVAGAVAVLLGASLALFAWVPVRPVPGYAVVERVFERSPVAALFLILPATLFEEVLFRLYLQGGLRRLLAAHDPGWTAIVVPAVVWALGHAGQVEPDFPKLVQMFVFGLVQGWIMERKGFESVVLVHVGFNLAALALGKG